VAYLKNISREIGRSNRQKLGQIKEEGGGKAINENTVVDSWWEVGRSEMRGSLSNGEENVSKSTHQIWARGVKHHMRHSA